MASGIKRTAVQGVVTASIERWINDMGKIQEREWAYRVFYKRTGQAISNKEYWLTKTPEQVADEVRSFRMRNGYWEDHELWTQSPHFCVRHWKIKRGEIVDRIERRYDPI